jgi:YD repeat-containing protein
MRAATQTYTYDARGNQSAATDARGFTTRMHYDAFDRLASMTAHDLTGRAAQTSQTTRYSWTNFDQLASYTDALQHTTTRTYDQNGNQTSERDANGHTETFKYSAENRLIQRTDRLGSTSLTEWDAYGQRISETDANGRVTRYQVGAFGQITGMRMSFAAGYGALKGAASSSETMRQDWLGRLVESTDSFGKHLTYGYNDADEQTRITDLALNKQADYGYDALGRRTHESLSKGGLVQREQTNSYNNQGWLTGVSAQAGYDAGGGAAINQGLQVGYGFDADGNRVRIRAEDGSQAIYSYDANGRMLQGRDDKVGDKPDQIVSALQYDGYGNRISETRAAATTTYTYDAANRVVASSAGETFAYDANGNTTEQRVKSEDGHLLRTVTTYNAENRATVTVSTDKDGKNTTSSNTYDAVGNVVKTHIQSETSSFDEVTQRDVRYLEQSKRIENGKAKGTAGLKGATTFTYDQNGNLVYLDRGVNQQTKQASVAVFEYDLEGHIIGRADKAGALAGTTGGADLFQGYEADPDAPGVEGWSEYGPPAGSLGPSVMDELRAQYAGSGAQLQSFLYANNKSLAQAQGTQSVGLVKLTLNGAVPITQTTTSGGSSGSGVGEGGNADPVSFETVIGWRLTLAETDIARDGAGQVDRAGTARRIAEAHYANFTNLSPSAQAKVVAYVQSTLPATITAGATVDLHGYIVLADGGMSDVTQITDYSVKRIGVDGMPGGSVQSHVVRAGDTLQSISQIYFGSPSYWYLIAEANGLQGHEALAEGTTITIPNKVVNAANSADTFKVYNESEIIGSTSPEIRTIKKKKKWWQKLVMILIVVIMIVAIVMTAGAALAAAGPAGATMLASLSAVGAAGASVAATVGAAIGVSGLALAAVSGALIMAAANVLTQGLSIAAKMQDGFEWKQVTKAAGTGAVSGAAAFLAPPVPADAAFSWGNVAQNVAVEAGKQAALNDGKITNVSGLLMAAASAGAIKELGFKDANTAFNAYRNTVGAGLNLLESKVRGQGDNAMQWVSMATSAIFDAGKASGLRTEITTDAGKMNWQYLAIHAVGAAIVSDSRGSDAGLNYLGSAIGSGVTARDARDGQIKQMGQTLSRDPAYQSLSAAEQRRIAVIGLDDGVGMARTAMGPDQSDAETARLSRQAATATGNGGTNSEPAAANGGSAFADNVAARKAMLAKGIDPNTGLPMGGEAAPSTDSRAAFRKSETEYRNATSAIVQKGDTVIEMAKRLYGDDWRAGVDVIAGSNNLKTDRYGNPIIREGQELNVLPLGGASNEALEQLGRAGGALVAGNTRRSVEVRAADALRAQAVEQQRIADLYASAGPRGGAGVAYGDAPRAASTGSGEGNADMFANLGPEFGGSSGATAERSPLLSRAAGAVELVAGGAWNSVVRIGGGVASIPFLLDSTDAASAVQRGFEDKAAYQPRTEGAREIVQALQPVAQYVGGKIDAVRSLSESKIGDGATTVLFAGGQFALEAGSTYFGGRAALAALEGRAAVGAAQATARSAVGELADGAAGVGASATRATALDFIDGAGRLGGDLYGARKLTQLDGYLERRGFTLKVGDEYLPAGKAGGFGADAREVVLKSNPTQYEVWHELSHFRQYQQLGADAYSLQTRVQKEQFVFDMLENSPKRWQSLSFDQQQHAIWYIDDVGGIR